MTYKYQQPKNYISRSRNFGDVTAEVGPAEFTWHSKAVFRLLVLICRRFFLLLLCLSFYRFGFILLPPCTFTRITCLAKHIDDGASLVYKAAGGVARNATCFLDLCVCVAPSQLVSGSPGCILTFTS